ncbi:DUF4350 domain-containing protein [Aestuariimicrobium soli]|uniref:DUF4350 domain-containing protein n=1 Tax=Aestuariimicrobium soli TaxID=2035834 RepID=UPI003EBEC17E
MSSPSPSRPAPSGVATAHRPFLARQGRSLTFWLVAVIALAVVATLVLWPAKQFGDNDPENQKREGMQALSQVLQKQGVSVTVVRTSAELTSHTPPAGATLVVTNRDNYLIGPGLEAVKAQASGYRRVVLLGQGSAVLRGLGLTGVSQSGGTGAVESRAECSLDAIGQTTRVALEGESDTLRGYRQSFGAPLEGCFPLESDSSSNAHALVRKPGNPEVIALADETLLTNGHILDGDNAALGLTLLGSSHDLVWYSSENEQIATDEPSDQPGLAGILPPWWDAVQRLLTWTIVVAALWQARRFGPLVTERMPVVVKAIETTISRGQLYHRAGARDRAVGSLQRATRARLRQVLALPHDSPDEELVRAVAAATGRDPREVAQVLTDTGTVIDDDTMVLRAQTLAQLEEEVRRR